MSTIAEHWEVIQSAWSFFAGFTLLALWLGFLAARWVYKHQVDNAKSSVASAQASVAYMDKRIDGYKAEVAGLKDQLTAAESRPNKKDERPPLELSSVTYGTDEVRNLFERLQRDEIVRLRFNPNDSDEWKSQVWKLGRDEFPLYAAARQLIDDKLADIRRDGSDYVVKSSPIGRLHHLSGGTVSRRL